jgi:hypothetical protein
MEALCDITLYDIVMVNCTTVDIGLALFRHLTEEAEESNEKRVKSRELSIKSDEKI